MGPAHGAQNPTRLARVRALGGTAPSRVRAALVNATRDLEAEDVVELLTTTANEDISYAARAAAINALVHHEAKDHVELIAELAHYPSQHDQVRSAALRGLAELDEAAGLPLAIQYSAYGNMDRARVSAIRAVGKLAHHDLDLAVPQLIALLDDPEQRTRRAAAGALVTAGDDRGLEPLRAIARTHRDPDVRERVEKQVKELEEKVAEGKGD